MKVEELCQLYISYASLNTAAHAGFYSQIVNLVAPHEVPKQYFCRYLQSLVEQLSLTKALEFLPFVEELREYGEIQFFFSHEDYVRLMWSSLILQQQT